MKDNDGINPKNKTMGENRVMRKKRKREGQRIKRKKIIRKVKR